MYSKFSWFGNSNHHSQHYSVLYTIFLQENPDEERVLKLVTIMREYLKYSIT